MSLSRKGIQTNDLKIGTSRGVKTLNPNAAAFIPSSFRSPYTRSMGNTDEASKFAPSVSFRETVIKRLEPSVLDKSDEEAHHLWSHQLPDDIIPDFKDEDESQNFSSLSLASLSLCDKNESAKHSASIDSGYALNELTELSTHDLDGTSFLTDKLRGSFGEEASSTGFLNMISTSWDTQLGNNDQLYGETREAASYSVIPAHNVNDVLQEHMAINVSEANPLLFLTSNFPGFAIDSLAEVYYANGCDMNMTIEMLTQLELQTDGAIIPNQNKKTLSAPTLTVMDCPALSVTETQNSLQKYSGDDVGKSGNPFTFTNKDNLVFFKSSSSSPSRGAQEFASAVKELPSQDSGIWKYERNGSDNSSVGSSRNSQILSSAYSSSGINGRVIYGDRLKSRASSRAPPVWLETGEAVGNTYSVKQNQFSFTVSFIFGRDKPLYVFFVNSVEMAANLYDGLREEARDHARLRNACLEQARRAYLVGNKALAKEPSVKGQLHNMQMKAAQGEAQESIYCQRNPVPVEMQGVDGRSWQERMIDLHGLHVNEAIHVLRQELAVLRGAVWATNQHLHVYICVGTGHHTRGSRTLARLPIAVQRYLLEEEGLEFSEPQPGLLRVVVY
ncbi:hypothetical protein SAY87_028514 [Trapa incisa]|uniref:Smr domain-containing protein n=1 Tax=Trapa incisa TaxID=236973 RepID=A0AAN7QS39_9MYRT|nr:hypothetical protein SAY87_028514 [Trapa incisa]